MRQTNKIFYIFLSLTIFLLAIHVKRVTYFENPSKELTEAIYLGQVQISANLSYYNNEYIVQCNFHNISTEIVVRNIDIELVQVDKSEKLKLILRKVQPYSGMHNWNKPEFNNFSKIPDSLNNLNFSSNPYFAYDFIFKATDKNVGEAFTAKISADFTENNNEKNITKELLIIKKTSFDIQPLDSHSDISFVLIPVSGFFTLVLFAIKVFLTIKRRQRVVQKQSYSGK